MLFKAKVSIFPCLRPGYKKVLSVKSEINLTLPRNTMKTNKFILSIATAFVMASGAPSAWAQAVAAAVGAPAASVPRAGIVKIIGGDVRVRDAQGERPLKSGDAVFANDRLISGKEGSASLVLRDGTTLVLANNSQLELQKFAFDATTQDGNMSVNLLQGSLRMLTGLIAKVNPDAIQVKTKTLSVGVRGTDFIVETEDKI